MKLAPFSVVASASLTAGQTQLLDTAALQHTFRNPVVIDEIRFTLWGPLLSAPIGAGFGGSIAAKLDLGPFRLTQNLSLQGAGALPTMFVPVWNFGAALQLDPENAPGSTVGGAGVDSAGKGRNYNFYRWILPKPLLVPDGMPLTASIARASDGFGSTINVECCFAGRILPAGTPVPKKLAIPYAVAWLPGEGTTHSEASNRDLANDLKTVLHVQRMTGRLQYRNVASSLMGDYIDGVATTAYSGTLLVPFGGPNVKCSLSGGIQICRDYVPWYEFFDAPRKAWTFDVDMAPGETMDLVYDTVDTQAGGNVTTFANLSPMAALIGWREELMS